MTMVWSDEENRNRKPKAGPVKASRIQPPTRPHSLESLQIECKIRYGMDPQEVAQSAHILYEVYGCISDFRSTSRDLPVHGLATAPQVVKSLRQMRGLIGGMADNCNLRLRSPGWNLPRTSGDHHGIVPLRGIDRAAAKGLMRNERNVFHVIVEAYLSHFNPLRVAAAHGGSPFEPIKALKIAKPVGTVPAAPTKGFENSGATMASPPPRVLDLQSLIRLGAEKWNVEPSKMKAALRVLHTDFGLITAWEGSDRNMPAFAASMAPMIIEACRDLPNGIGAAANAADPKVKPPVRPGAVPDGHGIIPLPGVRLPLFESLNPLAKRVYVLIAKAFLANFDPHRIAAAKKAEASPSPVPMPAAPTALEIALGNIRSGAPVPAPKPNLVQPAPIPLKRAAAKRPEIAQDLVKPRKARAPVVAPAPAPAKSVKAKAKAVIESVKAAKPPKTMKVAAPVLAPVPAPVVAAPSPKREAFKRLGEARAARVIDGTRLIGNLSNLSDYEFTEAQVGMMFDAIEVELTAVKSRFEASLRRRDRRPVLLVAPEVAPTRRTRAPKTRT